MTPYLYRCIGQSVRERTSLMSDLADKLARINKRDAEAQEQLVELVPEEIRSWIINEDILPQLFRCGRYDTHIHFYDKEYCFKDLKDVAAKMKSLAKAWKDIVFVDLSKNPERHRINIRLSAVM